MGLGLLLFCFASCGRIGFDALGIEDDAGVLDDADTRLGLSQPEDLIQCPMTGRGSNDGNEVLLAYSAYRPGESKAEIRFAVLSATGALVLGPLVVSGGAEYVEVLEVFETPTSGYAIFFQSEGTVRMLRLAGDGAAIAETEVATNLLEPTVAITASGYLVTYEDAGRRLQTVPVSPLGVPGAVTQLETGGRDPISLGIDGDVLVVVNVLNGTGGITRALRLAPDGSLLAPVDISTGSSTGAMTFDSASQDVAYAYSKNPDREELSIRGLDVSGKTVSLGADPIVVSPDNRSEDYSFSLATTSEGNIYVVRKSDAFTANSQVGLALLPSLAAPQSLSQFTTGTTEIECPMVVTTESTALAVWIQHYQSTRALQVQRVPAP